MTTPNPTSEYLLLFRGSDWARGMAPAELQKAMANFLAWSERLDADGTLKAGQPLMSDARTVSGKGGRTVADGPFAESKEAVGGYLLIRAGDFDEAVVIARGCPILEHGTVVEVRPVAPECPILERARQRAQQEPALAGLWYKTLFQPANRPPHLSQVRPGTLHA